MTNDSSNPLSRKGNIKGMQPYGSGKPRAYSYPESRQCVICERTYQPIRWSQIYCEYACTRIGVKVQMRACYELQLAIRKGELPRANTLACADCGKPASEYDHRDYGKPLQVAPVCRACNQKRGPALFPSY